MSDLPDPKHTPDALNQPEQNSTASGRSIASGRAEGGQARQSLTFPRRLRIVSTAEFKGVLRAGKRANDGRLTVWALRNELPHPRLGLVVGRKHGGAVARNRLKRVIRSAFRLLQHELPTGLDLVCSPRPSIDLSLEDCQRSLRNLAAQLARRLRPNT